MATLAYDARDAVTNATDFKGVTTTYGGNAFGEARQEISADIAGAPPSSTRRAGLAK